MTAAGWRIGADIGGTFTDIVALSPTGELERMKVLSTVEDYSRGITEALRERLSGEALAAVTGFVHGTTVATNAILQETRPTLALITTKGFRDTLEIRRSRRPTLYDLDWQPPPPLVERRMRLEVDERLAADGSVLVPLAEEAVTACIEAVRDEGIEAIAVCLLHSYANPAHEQRVMELLAVGLPDIKATASSSIAPEAKEYERTSTTVVNAFLLPVVDDYLSTLERSLRELGVTAPLQIMQSDGTTAAAAVTRERPFLIIESGPAAGVSAAARLAEEMGRDAVVTFDMGGTTAKASLVEERHVVLSEELEVGDSLNRGGGLMRGSGYVVRSPCVDLTEVGSGGGSIAWIDGGGALRVGPRSAGSYPGPACYGQGGVEPTVTDAHVVLGYVNPESIAGGTKRLFPEQAHAAIETVAGPLGLSVEEAAYGIFSIATATMRRAVRAVSVERGRDPRAHSLFAFGGAGGIHAAALAAEMEMPEVVIPVVAGLFSSLGLLFSDLAVTRVVAHRARLEDEALPELEAKAEALAREASEELQRRSGGDEAPTVELFAGLRYVGQSSTLTLPFREVEGDRLAALRDSFHREHKLAYGQSAEDEPVEVTALRARASRRAPVLSFAEIGDQYLAGVATAAPATRELYFGPIGGRHATPIVDRGSLAGEPVDGPLVIEEPEATIVVPPDFTAELHPTGSVVLRPRPGR